MSRKIYYDDSTLSNWIDSSEFDGYIDSAKNAQNMLNNGTGQGSDYLGWLNLPKTIAPAQIRSIVDKAEEIRSKADVLLCIGIGGSYLGAKAAIDFLSPSFDDLRKPRILFAGHQISSDYLTDLFALLEDKSVAVNIISKSGTTTEPGVAF